MCLPQGGRPGQTPQALLSLSGTCGSSPAAWGRSCSPPLLSQAPAHHRAIGDTFCSPALFPLADTNSHFSCGSGCQTQNCDAASRELLMAEQQQVQQRTAVSLKRHTSSYMAARPSHRARSKGGAYFATLQCSCPSASCCSPRRRKDPLRDAGGPLWHMTTKLLLYVLCLSRYSRAGVTISATSGEHCRAGLHARSIVHGHQHANLQAATYWPGVTLQGYAASFVAMSTPPLVLWEAGSSVMNLPSSCSLRPFRRPVPALCVTVGHAPCTVFAEA